MKTGALTTSSSAATCSRVGSLTGPNIDQHSHSTVTAQSQHSHNTDQYCQLSVAKRKLDKTSSQDSTAMSLQEHPLIRWVHTGATDCMPTRFNCRANQNEFNDVKYTTYSKNYHIGGCIRHTFVTIQCGCWQCC